MNSIVFKYFTNQSPIYFNEVFESAYLNNLRARNTYLHLTFPFQKINTGQNLHSFIGSSVWNKTPQVFKKVGNMNTSNFKKILPYTNQIKRNHIFDIIIISIVIIFFLLFAIISTIIYYYHQYLLFHIILIFFTNTFLLFLFFPIFDGTIMRINLLLNLYYPQHIDFAFNQTVFLTFVLSYISFVLFY